MPTNFATLLLTRPDGMNDRVLEALGPIAKGVEVVKSPLLDIRATGAMPDLSSARGVIFTSRNGVQFAGASAPLKTYCVGPATADVAQSQGWKVAHVAQNAEDLVQNLITLNPVAPLLHIAGVARRGEIAERLTQAGILTDVVAVYDQQHLPLSPAAHAAIMRETPVIVPLYSPRTAQQFVKDLRDARGLHIVCLSDAVRAEVANVPNSSLSVAANPNGESMLQAIQNVLGRVETEHAPK